MGSVKVVKVPVEALTSEAFAPFGHVIRSYEERQPEIVKGGLREKQIPVSSEVRRWAHFAYHTDAGQSFYPSLHRPFVFMVGPVNPTLSPADIRAFYSDGSMGICLGPLVWHTMPICVDGEDVIQSTRGDQDYLAHSVEIDFDVEQGLTFEPDMEVFSRLSGFGTCGS